MPTPKPRLAPSGGRAISPANAAAGKRRPVPASAGLTGGIRGPPALEVTAEVQRIANSVAVHLEISAINGETGHAAPVFESIPEPANVAIALMAGPFGRFVITT